MYSELEILLELIPTSHFGLIIVPSVPQLHSYETMTINTSLRICSFLLLTLVVPGPYSLPSLIWGCSPTPRSQGQLGLGCIRSCQDYLEVLELSQTSYPSLFIEMILITLPKPQILWSWGLKFSLQKLSQTVMLLNPGAISPTSVF